MKLKEEFIEKYLNDFHYELTREQLEDDWHLDEKWPYYIEKKAFNLRSKNNAWMEIPFEDFPKAFIQYDEREKEKTRMGTVEPCWDNGVICDEALAFINGAIKKYGSDIRYIDDMKKYISNMIQFIGTDPYA